MTDPDAFSGLVRATADMVADALGTESFAGAVDEALRPLYADIAAAHEAHVHYAPESSA